MSTRSPGRLKRKQLSILVVIETAIIGLVAMGVFALIVDRYEHATTVVAERTAVVRATDVFVAMLTATPPTATPTFTHTPSRTPTRTQTPTKTNTPTPSISPTPTLSPTPSLSPTPRPTTTQTPIPVTTINQCRSIDEPGNYRLGADIAANGDCIKVRSSYVILDCNNHAIRGTNFGGSGIAIRKYGFLNTQTPAYVEVRGCRVSNFQYGIYVEAGNRLVIRNNDASNNFDDVDPATRFGKFLGMTDGGGIRVNNTTDSQILSNTTVHQAIGIDVRYSSGVVVRSNTSSDNSAWGINFLRTVNSEASGNTTTDNVRKCTWGAGTVGFGCDAGGIVVQDGSSGNLIANNNVNGRNGNGVFIKAHALPCGNNNTIIGNTITSVLYNSVELSFCTGNKVNNNQIHGGLDGVWLGFAHDTEIKGNVITNMSNHGVISLNSHGNMISGNQIISSNEGLYFYSEDYDKGAYSFLPPGDYRSHSNCLCNNTLQGNNVAVHLQDSTSNQVTGNTYASNGRIFLIQGNSGGNNLQGALVIPQLARYLTIQK